MGSTTYCLKMNADGQIHALDFVCKVIATGDLIKSTVSSNNVKISLGVNTDGNIEDDVRTLNRIFYKGHVVFRHFDAEMFHIISLRATDFWIECWWPTAKTWRQIIAARYLLDEFVDDCLPTYSPHVQLYNIYCTCCFYSLLRCPWVVKGIFLT